MNATATASGPSELLHFDNDHSSFTANSTAFVNSDERPLEIEESDFDTFVEDQLRDGTGSLYADAMMWMERRLLVRVLALTNGNKSKACQILGITRGSLRHKICQLGISIHQTVSVQEMER